MRIIKIAAFAAFFSSLLMLAGCAGITAENPAAVAVTLQNRVVKICRIAGPVVKSMQAAETAPIESLDKAAEKVHMVCDNTNVIDTTNIAALVDSGVPLLIAAIQQSSMTADAKNTYTTGLIGAQTAILLLLPMPTTATSSTAAQVQ